MEYESVDNPWQRGPLIAFKVSKKYTILDDVLPKRTLSQLCRSLGRKLVQSRLRHVTELSDNGKNWYKLNSVPRKNFSRLKIGMEQKGTELNVLRGFDNLWMMVNDSPGDVSTWQCVENPTSLFVDVSTCAGEYVDTLMEVEFGKMPVRLYDSYFVKQRQILRFRFTFENTEGYDNVRISLDDLASIRIRNIGESNLCLAKFLLQVDHLAIDLVEEESEKSGILLIPAGVSFTVPFKQIQQLLNVNPASCCKNATDDSDNSSSYQPGGGHVDSQGFTYFAQYRNLKVGDAGVISSDHAQVDRLKFERLSIRKQRTEWEFFLSQRFTKLVFEVQNISLPYSRCDTEEPVFLNNFLRLSKGIGSSQSHEYICEEVLRKQSNRIVFGQPLQEPITVSQSFCGKDGDHEDPSHHRPNIRLDYLPFWSFSIENFDISLPSPLCKLDECLIDLPDSAERLNSVEISWLSHDTACFEGIELEWKPYKMEPQRIIMNDEKVLLSSAKNQEQNQKFYTGIDWYSSMSPNQNTKSSFYRRRLFTENAIGQCQVPVGWTAGGKLTLGGGRECATIIKSLGRKNRILNLNGRMLKEWCQLRAFSIFVCKDECQSLEICDSGSEMVPEVTKKLDKFSGSLVILQEAKTDILLDLHFTDEREAEIVLRNC
ncbi:Oidioi.mRNA.OKI2018_I69.chr2.g8061.t1.cds [Oikopleura dioica]|uniref:Oidioi.mRNA.OKI2018_I69.chr2.g8061.t1.cds n=1 Tax=Oikopleura dioica TaxID=34765 RepID=A0ABN7T8K7_OIKDI|nr:Oidioi.mRNA.OKI2018_I69.chr2.g8061.t1.cds [Oikopleura dioica]